MSTTYSGHVYNRKDNSPIPNVPVSDGMNTVFTDENGAFHLRGWERARMINVGVLTERHCDWYIRIDGHKGDFNFYIDKTDVSHEDFCFFHTSDTEIENRKENDWISFAKSNVKRIKPAFFMHTGDLCREDGVKRHYLTMNRETVGCPVRYCIGNHDFIGEEYGEEIYEKLYGPCWYSFDCGNIHFVALSIGAGDNPSGYKHEDQWQWLINDLETAGKDKKIIVCCHDLCASDPTGFTKQLGNTKLDLKEKGLLAWVFGHYHIHLAHEYNGVLNISTARPDSGGIDSSPAGIRRITVEKDRVSTDIIYNISNNGHNLTSLWETKLRGNVEFSDMLMQDNSLFAATSDDGYPKKCGIYKLDPDNGNILFFFETKGGIKGGIAYDNGRIYAQDSYGTVYCIDAENGNLIWKTECEMPRSGYTTLGVIIAEDFVIAGAHSHPTALNKENGEKVWDTRFPNCEEGPAKTVYDKKRKRLYFSLNWRSLICTDLFSGEIIWENTDKRHCWYRTSTPALYDDYIYLGGLYTVAKLDAETGKTLLSVPIQGRMDVCGAPMLDGEYLYFPTADKGVLQVDKNTLETKTIYPCGNSSLFTSPYIYGNVQMVESSPIIAGDTLIFTASDWFIHFYDKDASHHRRIIIGNPSIVKPIVYGENIIVADYCGNIMSFNKNKYYFPRID